MSMENSVSSPELAVVILAAGEGTRMKSSLPKVLHKVCGRPMIVHVLDTVVSAGVSRKVVVVGHKGEQVKDILDDTVNVVFQENRLGTGDAVKQTRYLFDGFNGNILVLYGDIPLLSVETICRMKELHQSSAASCTLLTVEIDNPFSYGRIIRAEDGNVIGIREEKDASEQEKAIKEINVGAYIFKSADLFSALDKVGCTNKSGEYYLTDTIAILSDENKRVSGYATPHVWETIGVNSPEELKRAEELLKENNR